MAAGMPWKDVPTADMSAVATGEFAYALQGAYDEAFLYFRLTFKEALPPPSSPLPGAPQSAAGMPDISPRDLRVAASGAAGNFEVSFDTTTISQFRKGQEAYALGYNVVLSGKDSKVIFYTNADPKEKLLTVGERDIIAKIPLESLEASPDASFIIGVYRMDQKVEYKPARF
jgi:hypothetical protein